MTEDVNQPDIAPAPTHAIVGYPEQQPRAAAPESDRLRKSLRTVQGLLVATLVLLVLLAAGFVAGIASLRAEVSALGADVNEYQQAAAASNSASEAPAAAVVPEAEPAQPEVQPQALQFPEGSLIPNGADMAGAIMVGNPSASTVVEVYVDYQCPFCQRWESEVGGALMRTALEPGSDLLIKQYNLAFLGETTSDLQPPGASARAASAAACVFDSDGAEVFVEFNAGIFESADPSEPPSQFGTDVLADVANQLGGSPESIRCIEEERFIPYAAMSTQAGFARGVQGTPTVLINGVVVESAFDDPILTGLITSQKS